ncbi:MAG: DUF2793 domain-containing protein [Paracoccus sp. (in: a-proteobacteria)]|nr:DUF2793 domain-containing protein [Paracoccus sp. (in: a-proteobacteria)]
MSEQSSARLGLPYLQPAQAQKHVTVNEALARLDGLVNPVLASISRASPPAAAQDGTAFGVPSGASGPWAGRAGHIAIASNGGWVFAAPRAGMRAFIEDEGAGAIHDGEAWAVGAATLSPSGSALCFRAIEAELELSAGAQMAADLTIPHAAMVFGVTARVSAPITGSLSAWSLGTEGALNRFGQGLGLGAGSWARGMLSQPVTYWAPSPLLLTAEGGSFAGGRVRLCAHIAELRLPS